MQLKTNWRRTGLIMLVALLVLGALGWAFGAPDLIIKAIGPCNQCGTSEPDGISNLITAANNLGGWLTWLVIGAAPLVALFGLISLLFGSRRGMSIIGTAFVVVLVAIALPKLAG